MLFELSASQVDLLRCLEFGLVSKCSKDCVRALTVCALEMVDMMMRQLPSILLRLSQISATMAMAIPLMEFLSSKCQPCRERSVNLMF